MVSYFIHCYHRITNLEKELNEANQKIMDLEVKNKQNDNDVEMLRGERSV